MKLVDATNWRNMEGKTNLEKRINSYLTCRFTLQQNVPSDECLSETKQILELIDKSRTLVVLNTVDKLVFRMDGTYLGMAGILGFEMLEKLGFTFDFKDITDFLTWEELRDAEIDTIELLSTKIEHIYAEIS